MNGLRKTFLSTIWPSIFGGGLAVACFYAGSAVAGEASGASGCPPSAGRVGVALAALVPTPAAAVRPPSPAVSAEAYQACEASIEQVRDGSRTLIDIRDARAHAKLSVPGALNLPAGVLRHRDFLKNRPLLLIDDGKSPAALLRVCVELREQGFADVRTLTGGLRDWHASGLPLLGDAPAIDNLYRLYPADLERESGRPGWHVVGWGISTEEAAQSGIGFQHTVPADVLGDPHRDRAQLRRLLTEQPRAVIVLATMRDEPGSLLLAGLPVAERARVLVLAGGVAAFQQYMQQHRAVVAQAGKTPVRPCYEQ